MWNILKENGHNEFEECLETSVKYHRYELTNWLNENYKCKLVSLPKCIWYYNIDAFLYFLEHGHSLDETDDRGRTCFHFACEKGHLSMFNILLKKEPILKQKKIIKSSTKTFHLKIPYFHKWEYIRKRSLWSILCSSLIIIYYLRH